MLLTNNIKKENYEEYSNKNSKISRDLKKGNIIKITNGLYETNPNVKGYLLASSIYGPSYLSFDFALSYYGLIPEKVTTFTSATCEKKKKKEYSNQFGHYTYRDIPTLVYPLGIKIIEEDVYYIQIATPEKALCDKLYTISTVKNFSELKFLLYEDLRIDEEELKKLNINDIKELSDSYHCRNVTILYRYIRRILVNNTLEKTGV